MKKEVLRIEKIVKKENDVKTLDQFSVNLFKGEVLGIFVNNTNEKNSLIDVIYGNIPPDMGRVYIGDVAIHYGTKIRNNKIALIESTSKLIDDLTVADNIFVIRNGFRKQVIHDQLLYSQSRIIFAELDIMISPNHFVYSLNRIEKSLIEIAKAYVLGAHIIILKDVSSFLSDLEIEQLYEFVDKLKKLGVSFLLIDSYTDIFKKFADRVVIMKYGKNIWTFQGCNFNEEVLKGYFYKRKQQIDIKDTDYKEIALEFKNVATKDLKETNLCLHEGEILTVFDSGGKEIREIERILKGEQTYKGTILIEHKTFRPRNQFQSFKKGITFISENPEEGMLFNNMSALDNLCYSANTKVFGFWLKNKYRKSFLKDYEQFFSPGALLKNIKELSIVDRHKLAYYKWHLYNPKVVVCIKPFSSVDMQLKEITLKLINDLCNKGIAVLILTSNYSEVNIYKSK